MGTSTFDFTDETVIVTGASSGIGRAIALRFGSAGANVVIADHSPEPKAEDESVQAHEVIDRGDGTAEYVETDVSNYDALQHAVEAAREYGGVDVMVNNAAVQHPKDFQSVSPEDLNTLYEVNVGGCSSARRSPPTT